MPKITKEQKEVENKKEVKTKKATSSKKTTTTKKVASKKASTEKTPRKKSTSTAKKETTKKADVKKASTKKTTSKMSTTKKTSTTAKKNTSKKTASTKKTTSKKSSIKQKVDFVEYYDLPYRYNQTVVKILAQTPNTLFIYWDISDIDRENLKKQYGDNFFEKTRPILIIHNDTMQYSFEVEINDFANSWYLKVNDVDCNYRIELGRRPIPEYTKNEPFALPDYFYITMSNSLISPNDHILFTKDDILIRNIKTNKYYRKSISELKVKNSMQKIYDIHNLYKKLYQEENSLYDLSNPSSGNPSSGNFRIGKF